MNTNRKMVQLRSQRRSSAQEVFLSVMQTLVMVYTERKCVLNIIETKESVQDYYGKVLKSSSDLKTSACCSTEAIPDSHKKILSQIDDEIMTKFYGCGSPLPAALEGC